MGHLRLFPWKEGLRAAPVCVGRGGGLAQVPASLSCRSRWILITNIPDPFPERGPAPGTPHTAGFWTEQTFAPGEHHVLRNASQRGLWSLQGIYLEKPTRFLRRCMHALLARSRNCVFPALSLDTGLFRGEEELESEAAVSELWWYLVCPPSTPLPVGVRVPQWGMRTRLAHVGTRRAPLPPQNPFLASWKGNRGPGD